MRREDKRAFMVDKMISIAMATYNGEKYIREQLDSILAQTFQNWELIISDDSSTDSTVKIIEEYANADARIHVVTPSLVNAAYFSVCVHIFSFE